MMLHLAQRLQSHPILRKHAISHASTQARSCVLAFIHNHSGVGQRTHVPYPTDMLEVGANGEASARVRLCMCWRRAERGGALAFVRSPILPPPVHVRGPQDVRVRGGVRQPRRHLRAHQRAHPHQVQGLRYVWAPALPLGPLRRGTLRAVTGRQLCWRSMRQSHPFEAPDVEQNFAAVMSASLCLCTSDECSSPVE